MKTRLPSMSTVIQIVRLSALGLLLVAADGRAQGVPRATAAGEPVLVRKLLGLVPSQGRIQTPRYTADVARVGGVPEEWLQVSVHYDTTVDWLDDATFEYFVLTELTARDGAKSYSFFKASVTYGDIEKGRTHLSTMYLRPAALKRFGVPVAIAVEVTVAGKVVAEKTEVAIRMPPGQWWRNAAVVGNEKLTTVREGYLLNRKQSPFAFINIDEEEFIK